MVHFSTKEFKEHDIVHDSNILQLAKCDNRWGVEVSILDAQNIRTRRNRRIDHWIVLRIGQYNGQPTSWFHDSRDRPRNSTCLWISSGVSLNKSNIRG